MFFLIIFFIAIWWLANDYKKHKKKYSNHRNTQYTDKATNNKKKCSCPYCYSTHYVDDGYYKCNCGRFFRLDLGKVYKEEETVSNIFANMIKFSAYLCRADGKITNSEVDAIKNFLISFNITNSQLKWCADWFNRNRDYVSTDYFYNIIKNYKNEDEYIFESCLNCFFTVASVDGGISFNQENMLKNLFLGVGLSQTSYYYYKEKFQNGQFSHQQYSSEKDDEFKEEYSKKEEYQYNSENNYNQEYDNEYSYKYYKILGLEHTASVDEIKKIYKKLAKEYHPDKHAHQNLSKEQMNDITEKFKQIQNAYDEIKKIMNF